MDRWRFFDITHADHVVCNPLSLAALEEAIGLVDLAPGARVLDIACGKGEFLIRLAVACGVGGGGIDLSPFFLAEAERRFRARQPGAPVAFLEMDGADFVPDAPHSFSAASCRARVGPTTKSAAHNHCAKAVG